MHHSSTAGVSLIGSFSTGLVLRATGHLLVMLAITALAAMPTALAADSELGRVLRALSQPLNDSGDLTPLVDASRRARRYSMARSVSQALAKSPAG